ncbi:MAG: hypothetical protein IIT65_08050, partial [Lachnospiraceae bacterium]|nr:hypothetical protein [Lachnospiraceae bacterium]
IESIDDDNVTFIAKDYKDDAKYKPMTLSGENFLIRFLIPFIFFRQKYLSPSFIYIFFQI